MLIRKHLTLYFKGFAMGSADVVPGVSGGTIALITGIYTQLLDAIKSVDSTVVRDLLALRLKSVFSRVHWPFLAVVLAGIASAIFFFTRIVPLPVLMRSHPAAVYGLFFGLIVGSIFFVARDVGAFDIRAIVCALLGTGVGFWVVNLVPTETPEHPLFVFFCGMLAISAMLLPGISGSFILLILRKYEFIFGQIGRLGGSETLAALAVLVPFGLGVLCGLALFSRFLSWLLHHVEKPALAVLLGFMIGSLWVIWPWQERVYVLVRDKERLIHSEPRLPLAGTPELWWGLVMMAVGLTTVVLLEKLARRKAPATAA
jgi:putative membrane protein